SAPPSAEGRWVLTDAVQAFPPSPGYGEARRSAEHGGGRPAGKADLKVRTTTDWAAAWAQQLLARHGVLTREAVASEGTSGGFGVVYPVLKAMEEAGRIRRGYFVAGLGATQFALPGALDLLRSLREPSDGNEVEVVMMS